MNAIIAEDDQASRAALEILFQQNGYTVQTCASKTKFYALIEHVVPDLVLLDLRLEDGSAFDILSDTQLRQKLQNTRFAVMTGSNKLTDLEEAQRLGAHHIFRKPFNLHDLLKYITDWVK